MWMRCWRSIQNRWLPAIPTGATPLRSFFMTWGGRRVWGRRPEGAQSLAWVVAAHALAEGEFVQGRTNMRLSVHKPMRCMPGCGPANSSRSKGSRERRSNS